MTENQNSDIVFASTLKEIVAYLYKAENQEQKDLAYNKIIELINARFGACPRCGHINSGGKFCSECGQELAGEILKENDENTSIDYLVVTHCGNKETVLNILNDKATAISRVQKYLSGGTVVELLKRTIEKVRL